mmetsp:Transcript_38205/g.91837  ORF Transcript_38205/g.91837 Transcript_38205/m.91837 type:complete len:123 (-) Transcript_38205:578-946(-)
MTTSPKSPTWFVWALAMLTMLSFVLPAAVLFDGSMMVVEEPKEVSTTIVPLFSFEPLTTPAESVTQDAPAEPQTAATENEAAHAQEAASTACRIGGRWWAPFLVAFAMGGVLNLRALQSPIV